MTTVEVIIIIVAAIVSGIVSPLITKWLLKKQKNWKHKPLKDNGRMDLIDEIKYRIKK